MKNRKIWQHWAHVLLGNNWLPLERGSPVTENVFPYHSFWVCTGLTSCVTAWPWQAIDFEPWFGNFYSHTYASLWGSLHVPPEVRLPCLPLVPELLAQRSPQASSGLRARLCVTPTLAMELICSEQRLWFIAPFLGSVEAPATGIVLCPYNCSEMTVWKFWEFSTLCWKLTNGKEKVGRSYFFSADRLFQVAVVSNKLSLYPGFFCS